MAAIGDFYDYRDTDGFGRLYRVHRRSIHPAMRVCREWGSLLLNDKTQVVCDSQECTDWLARYYSETGFMPAAQNTVVRAFGMGTGAWALWVDADAGKIRGRWRGFHVLIGFDPACQGDGDEALGAAVAAGMFRVRCGCAFHAGLRVERAAAPSRGGSRWSGRVPVCMSASGLRVSVGAA